MQATATMLVAADRPPMKTKIDSQSLPPDSGRDSTNRSGLCPGPSSTSPPSAIGTTNRLISSM